jgi:hypothetical protein
MKDQRPEYERLIAPITDRMILKPLASGEA